MKKPLVIIDKNIPLIKGLIEPIANVMYLKPVDINPESVANADALIIRTRTKCNEELLRYSKVKFIATATIGMDHIDTDYCHQNNITVHNVPGCNALSVYQYVLSALLHVAEQKKVNLQDRTLGIIGVGNVGRQILHMAEHIGMRVLLNDPPRLKESGSCGFVSLQRLLLESDIVTLHVPLVTQGDDPTMHLINEEIKEFINPGTWLVNSSRGEVAETNFVKQCINEGIFGAAIIDVWENEPNIDGELMQLSDIATPHIAGYSLDGKANATFACVKMLYNHLGANTNDIPWPSLPEPQNQLINIDAAGKSTQQIIAEAVHATYPVAEDDKKLRLNPESFEEMRGNYPIRREPHAFTVNIQGEDQEAKQIIKSLGFKVNQ